MVTALIVDYARRRKETATVRWAAGMRKSIASYAPLSRPHVQIEQRGPSEFDVRQMFESE